MPRKTWQFESTGLERLKEILRHNPETGEIFNVRVGRNLTGKNANGYMRAGIEGIGKFYLHRLAWFLTYGVWPAEIDHVNRNRLDNRLCNLREASHQQNSYNSPKRSHSQQLYKGVRKTRSGTYSARIRYDGKEHHIGTYADAREAFEEYIFACLDKHGEFMSAD